MVRERYDVWLRRERQRRAWTQVRVATELQKLYEGSSATAGEIGRWERGVRIPRSSNREWLCKLYETDPDRIQWSREEDLPGFLPGHPAYPSPHQGTVLPGVGNSDSPVLPIPPSGKSQDIPQALSSVLHPTRTFEELGEAPDVGEFYGREQTLTLLESWIVSDSCRVVAILGLGGIGKSALAVKVTRQVEYLFDYVLWKNLLDAPPLEHILKDCILFFSKQEYVDFPEDEDGQLLLLIQLLRAHRCLLVLDNVESVLEGGHQTGHYREGYVGYGKLIRRIAESSHQSCILLTSREKLQELIAAEGNTSTTRSLNLQGLSEVAGKEILRNKGLTGSSQDLDVLIHHYGGNPLALKLVAEPILELFRGDVSKFVEKDLPVDDVYDVLSKQFLRLSELEQDILYWLAIEREAVSIADLQRSLMRQSFKRGEVPSALMSLRHRSMIETNESADFILQPVIMEFVTDRLLENLYIEVETEQVHLFNSHALIKAQSKDYVRDSQIRLILQPLASRLLANFGRERTAEKLMRILSTLRHTSFPIANYVAGNALNLLIHLGIDLRGYDFSYLTLRQAYLQGVSLPDVSFAYADLESSVFTDNFGSIFSTAVSSRGDLIAAGLANGEIRLLYKDGTPHRTCRGHTDWARSVAFSPGGGIIASGSYDQTVRLWDVSTGECLRILHGHSGRIYSVAFNSNGDILASAGGDHTVRLWEVDTGRCLSVLRGHNGAVYAVSFDPYSNRVVSGGEDKIICFWEADSGQCLNTFFGHKGSILSIAVSPDGHTLASGGENHELRIWDKNAGKCMKILSGHEGRIWSVAFSQESNILFSGGEDQYIRKWNISEGSCLKVLQGHHNWVWALALSSEGNLLVSGSEDQTIKFWETNTGHCFKTLQGYSNWVYSIACSSDGKSLVSSGADQSVRLWKTSTGQCLRVFQGHSSWVYAVAFSSDGSMIASGSQDQSVRLWEASTGQTLRILHGHQGLVRSVAFSPGDSMLASGSEDQTVRLWELHSGQCKRVFRGHDSWIRSVVFSYNGSMIISGSEDETIRLWNSDTGECLAVLKGHTSRIYSIALNCSGSLLASGSGDKTIKLWDVTTGSLVRTLDGHEEWVRSVAFSPNGESLASASADHTIKIWSVDTGECIRTLPGHSSWVYSVAFTADGNTIVSGGGDGAIKLWDVQTGICKRILENNRPYEHMEITGIRGLSSLQKATLKALGAFENEMNGQH